MKKKILILILAICSLTLTACGNKELNLNDYLIEERQNLYTAQDSLYSATFSSGLREENYDFDGIKNNMVEFGIITLARLDCAPMSNDTYTYTIKINDQTYNGTLTKSEVDNSYSADIQVSAPTDAVVSVQVVFTGYSFNKEMVECSKNFSVDKQTALKIANKTLKPEIKELTSDKNNKIEAVMKIVKDSATTESNYYYWYVGVVSTNGDVVGVLVDASTGEIIAKKV